MSPEQRRGAGRASRRFPHPFYRAMIRIIVLAGVCVLMAMLNSEEVSAAIENHPVQVDVGAQKKESSVVPEAAPAKFRSNTEDYSGRIIGSLGFVLLVAVAGFVTVRVMKRKEGLFGKDRAAKDYGVRLLSFKRIAPRLNILVVDVGRGKVVTLADNGNSLLKLAEVDQGSGSSVSTTEGPHEK